MSHVTKLGILLCGLSIAYLGCRKEPTAPSSSAPTSKSGEGPVLAPPQQPTEGNPAGKTTSAPGAPANNTLVTEPTEGDPTANAPPSSTAEVAKDPTAAAKIKANLASLSTAERAIVEKQKICPVSGEPLGEMGAPKKVTVAGHDVFICCAGCKEALTKDPAKFLAKIGLEPAK